MRAPRRGAPTLAAAKKACPYHGADSSSSGAGRPREASNTEHPSSTTTRAHSDHASHTTPGFFPLATGLRVYEGPVESVAGGSRSGLTPGLLLRPPGLCGGRALTTILLRRVSLRQKRVAQPYPQEPQRDASPSVGGEQEQEEREESEEQHAAPTRQHPRPQGGYAQQWEPHEPTEHPRDEDRAQDGLAEGVPGDDRDHGNRTQEHRPQEGQCETHCP